MKQKKGKRKKNNISCKEIILKKVKIKIKYFDLCKLNYEIETLSKQFEHMVL